MATQASALGSEAAETLGSLVAWFDEADTDGDGKVRFHEAQAFRASEVVAPFVWLFDDEPSFIPPLVNAGKGCAKLGKEIDRRCTQAVEGFNMGACAGAVGSFL